MITRISTWAEFIPPHEIRTLRISLEELFNNNTHNGLRFKTISTGNIWFLTVRKDGEKIGFYKFSFVGEGPYNQKTDPECYFNIYTHDADLITGNPAEIFRQDFIQPQTLGEEYYKLPRSSYKHGTFDF